jgi:hypothetical protein
VAIIDPAYTLVLGAAIAGGLWKGVATEASRRVAWGALALTTAYLGAGLLLNHRVEVRAREQLAREDRPQAAVSAYPTMFQLPFRRVVARDAGEVLIAWTNALGPSPLEWERFAPATGPLVDAARATPEARVLEWFAMGEATPRLVAGESGTAVEIDDLRYGFPGHPRDGLWGVRVFLDASGRPVRAERFDRPLPVPPRRLLEQLWRGTLGLS